MGELDAFRAMRHVGVEDARMRQHRAHRHRAVGDALGQSHEVGHDARPLRGEGRAQAAEAGDDLVEDQQDAVPVADLAQARQIALRRRIDAARSGDRLDHHRGHSGRIVDRQQRLERVGHARALGRTAMGKAHALRIVGQRQMRAVEQRPEIAAMPADAADREPAKTHAVIALGAPDQLGTPAIAGQPVIAARDLDRGVDRLRSGIGEESMVEPGRRQLGQRPREGDRAGMRHAERRHEIEFARRLADRLDDRRAAMAGIDAPQPRHGVDHAAPVGERVVHPLRRRDHQRRVAELAHRGEGHPQRVAEVVGLRCAGAVSHGWVSSRCHAPAGSAKRSWRRSQRLPTAA
jgi:hypothetical protein